MEDKEKIFKTKNNNDHFILILIITIVMFMLIAGVNIYVNSKIANDIKSTQKQNLASIEESLKNIKITDSNNNKYHIIVDIENAEKIKAQSDYSYKEFIVKYAEHQADWFNKWLTILSIILGVLGLIIPICFMKLYYDKKEEINDLIKETKQQKKDCEVNLEKMENNLKKSNDNLILMKKDLNEVKKFYDETKAESEFADLLYKYNNNKESKQRIAHGLKHILRVKPKHIGACTTLACIYVDEGKYIEAVDYAKKAYKYSGQKKEFLYNVIETLLLSEQFEEAIKYLKQYKNYEYAKIYEEDYEKWVSQINKIVDDNKKNLALDIVNKLPKIKRNNSPLKLAADKINKKFKESENNDK